MTQRGALVEDGGSVSVQLSGRRSRIFHSLKDSAKNHPGVDHVQFRQTRDGNDHKLTVQLDPDRFVDGIVDCEELTLEINWWTHPGDIDDQFIFHYVESGGYDCGWHRQPHPDEPDIPFDHFQQRASHDDEYQYQGVEFEEKTPVGLFWEISRSRLPRIVRARWE